MYSFRYTYDYSPKENIIRRRRKKSRCCISLILRPPFSRCPYSAGPEEPPKKHDPSPSRRTKYENIPISETKRGGPVRESSRNPFPAPGPNRIVECLKNERERGRKAQQIGLCSGKTRSGKRREKEKEEEGRTEGKSYSSRACSEDSAEIPICW